MALKELYARSGGHPTVFETEEEFDDPVWFVKGKGIWMVSEQKISGEKERQGTIEVKKTLNST